MKKILIVLFVVLTQIACDKKGNSSLETKAAETVTVAPDYELQLTLEQQEELKAHIIDLSRKKDSLQSVLKSTKESMSRINDSKIDKGIEGVNTKLNELKGQKENFEEQVALQKKETELALKKVELLNQEKVVYDAQRKALYDKGAAPKDFVKVDSLLAGINGKIGTETKKVKNLNRNVADVEEQIVSIVDKRSFLSAKIRENYNAQEIFSEYAKEEESVITSKIDAIDKQISELSSKVADINTTVVGLNDDIATKEATDLETQIAAENDSKTKNRLLFALIAVGIISLVFYVLYVLGKRKKNNKTNK
ncbi:hypothetical protein [uncultured Flavobacterium sp.]|uniref:hypothetical protein n=1 Tax=uncultured Flavobacterium sp. TaxID=165435 RepID=UPI0030EECE3F|tara:strand:- start:102387 stop:103310 length:924 start_codon:yes stop_codon:yes gene_type:complete